MVPLQSVLNSGGDSEMHVHHEHLEFIAYQRSDNRLSMRDRPPLSSRRLTSDGHSCRAMEYKRPNMLLFSIYDRYSDDSRGAGK